MMFQTLYKDISIKHYRKLSNGTIRKTRYTFGLANNDQMFKFNSFKRVVKRSMILKSFTTFLKLYKFVKMRKRLDFSMQFYNYNTEEINFLNENKDEFENLPV